MPIEASRAFSRRCFVLAVAVAVFVDVLRGMRLIAADGDFNGDISDLALRELGDGLHAIGKVCFPCDQFLCLGRHLGSSGQAVAGKLVVKDQARASRRCFLFWPEP